MRLRGQRAVPLRRWFKLELAVDGKFARLSLDFLEQNAKPSRGLIFRDPKGELWISGAASPVIGKIDTVEIFAYEITARTRVPMRVDFKSGPETLYFGPNGTIDRRFHPKLPVYTLQMDDWVEKVEFESGGLAR